MRVFANLTNDTGVLLGDEYEGSEKAPDCSLRSTKSIPSLSLKPHFPSPQRKSSNMLQDGSREPRDAQSWSLLLISRRRLPEIPPKGNQTGDFPRTNMAKLTRLVSPNISCNGIRITNLHWLAALKCLSTSVSKTNSPGKCGSVSSL